MREFLLKTLGGGEEDHLDRNDAGRESGDVQVLIFCCISHISLFHIFLFYIFLFHISLFHISLYHISLFHISLFHISLFHISLFYIFLLHISLFHICQVAIFLVETLVERIAGLYTGQLSFLHLIKNACACACG